MKDKGKQNEKERTEHHAIEELGDDGKTTKAAIFTKRTIVPEKKSPMWTHQWKPCRSALINVDMLTSDSWRVYPVKRIQRVFSMVSPSYLHDFQKRWNEVMSGKTGDRIKKVLALDGKRSAVTVTPTQKANHIVSAVDENGFCLGEVLTDEKSNEITAIPELLNALNIQGQIITTDAMGCQTEIQVFDVNPRLRNIDKHRVLA